MLKAWQRIQNNVGSFDSYLTELGLPLRLLAMQFLFITCLFSSPAFAAEDYISCTSPNPSAPETVVGENVDQLYPIASLSKVMTTYWAVHEMGVQGRFKTRFHLRPLGKGKFDLHIEGSRDPYTDQAMFQFVVGQLNRLGIKEVEALSFDENFKFRRDLRGSISYAYMENDAPKFETVQFQMKQMMVSLKSDYEIVRTKAQAYLKMTLPKSLTLTAKEVYFLSKDKFPSKEFSQAKVYESTHLQNILKEMNRNSNNHAATQIYESLGGSAKFTQFIQEKLGLTDKEIVFYNGSGNRLDLSETRSVYNLATCRAMLKVNQALVSLLKLQDSSLEKVLSLAGRVHSEDSKGSLERYNSEEVEGRLIAKTGTVARAVTLGGLLKTKENDLYFTYIFRTQYSEEDWGRARDGIAEKIQKLAKSAPLGEKLSYRPPAFLPFDTESVLK